MTKEELKILSDRPEGVTVRYQKKDGSLIKRKICTNWDVLEKLKEFQIPGKGKPMDKNKKEPAGHIMVWDKTKNGFRDLIVDNIKNVVEGE